MAARKNAGIFSEMVFHDVAFGGCAFLRLRLVQVYLESGLER